MAAELVAQLDSTAWFRESSLGYNQNSFAVMVGSMMGIRLNKLTIDGYSAKFVIPGSITMATGLTFSMLVTDNAEFSTDPGKVVRLGITVKRLISGETPNLDVNAGTEQTVDVTLQATSGQLTLATLAIAAANLDSAVVGDHVGVRLRRVSNVAQDTCQGSVVLVACTVKNT